MPPQGGAPNFFGGVLEKEGRGAETASAALGCWGIPAEALEPVFPEVPAEVELLTEADSGTCGSSLSWTLDAAEMLRVSGAGILEMG